MSKRVVDPRMFVNDMAGVDDDEESSDDEDMDLDRWDTENVDGTLVTRHFGTAANNYLDSLQSAVFLHREVNALDETDDLGDVEELLAHFRERDQSRRRSKSASLLGEGSFRSDDFERKFGASLNALPCSNDISIFGVFCQVSNSFIPFFLKRFTFWQKRKEDEVVYHLWDKMRDTQAVEVISVFSVPSSPGRVYFEAQSSAAVVSLCEGMLSLYIRSLFPVTLAERIALLRTDRSNPLIEKGTWVRVKNGLYKGDLGSVVSVIGSHDAVVVKLKSREKHHMDSSRKRKRKRPRPEPYTLAKHPILPQLSDGTQIEVTVDGFEFNGKSYTNDGFLLLEFRCDRVERVTTGIAAYNVFVQSESANAAKQHSPAKLVDGERQQSFDLDTAVISIPLFFNLGNRVLISKGAAEGARGTIDQLTREYALITLDEDIDSDLRKTSFIQTEVGLKDITRLFDFGEHVEVKVGVFAGKSGTVGDVQGDILSIVDLKQSEVVSDSHFIM